MEIKLGSLVKDATTGYAGITIYKQENMNGNVQYAIQPEVKDGGSYPDAMLIDNHLIDVIGDGVSNRTTEVTHQTDIALGNTVEDIATGFRGIATHKATYMNGCVSFWVCGKIGKDGTTKEGWVDQMRAKKIDDGIAPKVEQPKVASNGKKPGGFASKAHRPM